MTEEELIKKYQEERRKQLMLESHASASQSETTKHQEYIHSTHETPKSTEAEEVNLLGLGTSNLEKARQEQAERGNTSFIGATGDNPLIDNNGNYVSTASPFDVVNQNENYVYATDQEIAKETVENKLPVSNVVADYQSAQLTLDADLAWSDYLENGTLASKKKAEEADKKLVEYNEKAGFMVGNEPIYLSPNAQQIPQQMYYLKNNPIAGTISAGVGGLTYKITRNPSWTAAAAKIAYDLALLGTSYESTRKMTQGSLYRELVKMGIPDDIAKYYAKDSAVQQAWVETGSGAIQNFAEWLIAFIAPGSVGSKIAKAVIGSKVTDVLTESWEEYTQEGQSIEAEKNALKAAGLSTADYTPEYEDQRKQEAAFSAVPITLGVGGISGTASQTINTVIVDTKNKSSIKKGYTNAINNLKQQNTELQNRLNTEKLTGKEKYTLNKQINDNNKQIAALEEASTDANVNSAYQNWKNLQKLLNESQELRDSTQFVETTYKDGTEARIKEAQTNARKQFGSEDIQIEATTNITQAEKNLKDVIEKRTGKDVVYYTTFGVDDLGSIHGFVQDNGTIYIEAGQSAKDTIASAIHEYGHILADENPTLFDTFKSLAKAKYGDELNNIIDRANKQTGTFKLEEGQKLNDYQKNYILEELFGDQLAEIASKKKNVKALENSTLSVFDKIKDVAKSVASEVTGVENTNQRISGYDYSGVSYANGDILQDESFEKQVMDTLKSIKNTDQAKETAKTTEEITKKTTEEQPKKAPKNVTEEAYARIEEQYKKMRGAKSPETIKKMIADELGLQYNGPKDNSSDANEVRRVYQDLKDHSGTLFSKRENDKGESNTDSKGNKSTTEQNESNYELWKWARSNFEKEIPNFIDTEEGWAAHKKEQKTLDEQYKIREEINKEMEDKGYVEYKLVNGDVEQHLTNKAKQHMDEVKDYQTRLRKSLDMSREATAEYALKEKQYTEKIEKDLRAEYEKIVNSKGEEIKSAQEQPKSENKTPPKRLEAKKKEPPKPAEANQNTPRNVILPKPTPQEKIVNNQRNEIERLSTENEELKEENKGLKKIVKGIKSTGRQQIRNVQSESNKMLKTGRETEYKLKGQIERAGQKYNRLSQAAVDLKFETQFNRKAQADGIKYGRDYKNLFIGLRREGKSITEAYNFTRDIYEASQELNKSIDNSMQILDDLRKKKVYNKLPAELKEKIDSYDKIWTGSRKQTDLMLAKRILDSATAKELLGKVALSKGVRNKIMNLEGDDFDGKGTISLEEMFNGSIGLAKSFEQGLLGLRQEIEEFQSINKEQERAKELSDDVSEIQTAVTSEIKKQGRQKIRGTVKNVTNRTLLNSLMTLKTEIQALMGGNVNTPMMKIQDNLQKGEVRKKQSIVEVYRILNDFMQKSSGANRLLGTKVWNKELEKSLSNKSKFVDTGMTSNGVDIKIPRSMMMSLAMHLASDENMMHISGGIVSITTDKNGNTTIVPAKGMGVRIPNEALFRQGKLQDAYDRGQTVRLTHEQVEKIVDMLTPEEKAFVEATKEVYKYTTKLINEVSNRIVGYDMATVENYFPIRVWDRGEGKGSVMNTPFQKRYGDALGYMLSPGWLQERVTSQNPIYLENIADVLNRSINNVTNFYGYAEALRDNHIILDSTMGDGTELTKNIGTLSSSFMPDYNKLTRFITGQESLKDGKFRGLMAMNTLTFNIGTWLTQPMSFFNTLKYYNTKEFMASLNPINNNVKLNNMIKNYFEDLGIDTSDYTDYEMARAFIAMATPNLDYRAIGYKTPTINQLFNKRLQDKVGAHGIQAFDNIAVTAIARMMAYSVSLDPNIEFGSEKYFEALGDRLTQVLVETQPEYSQVNRANLFRSTNPITRMLSLFGTPANQMMNNLMQSVMEVGYEAREGKVSGKAKADLAKSISGIVVSSMLVGLIRALRDKVRDDDDEEKFSDRWIAQSVIALLGPTLILDDIAQYIMAQSEFGGMSSYDFNTPETTFMNGITNLADKIGQLGKEGVSPAKKTADIIKALGVITPIDTKSVVRITEALMKWMSPDLYGSYSLQKNQNAYKKWSETANTPMAEFYKAYQATRKDSLEKNYGYVKGSKTGTESSMKSAYRRALEDTVPASEVNKYMEILGGYKS